MVECTGSLKQKYSVRLPSKLKLPSNFLEVIRSNFRRYKIAESSSLSLFKCPSFNVQLRNSNSETNLVSRSGPQFSHRRCFSARWDYRLERQWGVFRVPGSLHVPRPYLLYWTGRHAIQGHSSRPSFVKEPVPPAWLCPKFRVSLFDVQKNTRYGRSLPSEAFLARTVTIQAKLRTLA